MAHGINDWEETTDIVGQKFCSCGQWLRSTRYHWKGETHQACSATCLMIEALREELVQDDA